MCVVIDGNAHGVRMIEQTRSELDAEHAAHGFVERLHADYAGIDKLFEMVYVKTVAHIHVKSRVKRHCGGFRFILGNAVADELNDRVVVADHESVKSHLSAEHVREEIAVRCGGNSGNIVECVHDGAAARLDGGAEIGEVVVSERLVGNFRLMVIASALCTAVSDVVLCACDNAVTLGKIVALKTTHLSRRHLATEVRILAGSFDAASPSRVLSAVHHRSERPVNAAVCSLSCDASV